MFITACIVAIIAALLGFILLAVFAWGELQDNPYPADEDERDLTDDAFDGK